MIKSSTPSFTKLLPKHMEFLERLLENGIYLKDNKKVKIKIFGLIGDLPALSKLTHTTQFNGKYGCIKCFNKGKYLYDYRKRVYLLIKESFLEIIKIILMMLQKL